MHVAEESEWLSFDAPTLKIFCSNGCNRVEAFNPVGAVDCLPDGRGNTFAFDDGKCAQVFSLAYLCQSCKKIPELFFVRRDGNRLTLVGRTPIEQVEMPNVIPKSMQRFYTGAIVAHQSGHTLAGVFMLRTLIEQWARCETKATSEDFADKVIDAYVAGLPEDFKRRFPALRDTYGHLSLDIHGAVGSEQAFEKSRSEIIEHFDARRLFNLDGRSS